MRALALLPLAVIAASAAAGELPFREVGRSIGLDFEHHNGMSGQLLLPEIMGPGVGLLDFDRDGDLDLLLRQGSHLAHGVAPAGGSRLYRNDAVGGKRRLVDVTTAAGLDVPGYGMGVAVGDVDGDGWPDLYLTNLGLDTLLVNREGFYEDWTERSGLLDSRWSVPAVFADFDGDGREDLFVGSYVDFRIGRPGECYSPGSLADYCGPGAYPAQVDRLLLNRGDGRFDDASAGWQLTTAPTRALGLIAADVNGDGWIDVFVASDSDENRLWINQGGAGFVDEGLLRGVAVNGRGAAEGSMGVDLADFDGDGDEDLFVSHVQTETHTLYADDGAGNYLDDTVASSLSEPSWRATGFGLGWLDFDEDTDLDLFVTNGLVRISHEQLAAGEEHPLGQRDQLFEQYAPGRFRELGDWSSSSGRRDVGRGLALGDVDGSATLDLVIANNHGAAQLFLNQPDPGRHRLAVRLVDASGGGARAGGRVELRLPDGRRLVARSRSHGSYASARDPGVFFGLGTAEYVGVSLRDAGTVRRLQSVPADRTLVVPVGPQ